MIGRNRSFIWKQQGKFSLGFYSAETVKIFSWFLKLQSSPRKKNSVKLWTKIISWLWNEM